MDLAKLLLTLYLALTEKALQSDTLHVISYIYEYVIVIWYQILHYYFLLLCFRCVIVLWGARTSPLGILLPFNWKLTLNIN